MESTPGSPQVVSEMLQKGTLRALDKNVADVVTVTQRSESSFADLSEVIMRDAALSTNLLATANSVEYAGVEPVKTISAAVIRLGFERIRMLALALVIFKQAGRSARTPDLYRMYAGTYFAASLAMGLLRRAGYKNAEEGFVAALLQQVPRLLLACTFPQRYKEAEKVMSAEGVLFEQACQRVFGIPYSGVRRAVLDHWHLAGETSPAGSSGAAPEAARQASLVQEAGHLADMLFGSTQGGESALAASEKRIAELLGEEGFSASEFVQSASEKDENLQRFFKLTPKDVEMMVRIAQWGRVSTAQIAASLTLGSAQEELEGGGEAPEIAIGNYLTEMLVLLRHGADINHVLLLAQEAAFRCVRPTHAIMALLDTSQTVLRGRFHAGAQGKLPPSLLTVLMSRKDSPVVQCMQRRTAVRSEGREEGWDTALLQALAARYILMSPIVAHDHAIGMQFLARSDEPAFSKVEQGWLEAITTNLGLAFEKHR